VVTFYLFIWANNTLRKYVSEKRYRFNTVKQLCSRYHTKLNIILITMDCDAFEQFEGTWSDYKIAKEKKRLIPIHINFLLTRLWITY
jgi:hypothetical protein